jgi:glutathione synthase/RimK-type ligase-like ATP-grasp enzyme
MNICYVTSLKVITDVLDNSPESMKEYFMQKRSSGFMGLLERGHSVYIVTDENYEDADNLYRTGYRVAMDKNTTHFGVNLQKVTEPIVADVCWRLKKRPSVSGQRAINSDVVIDLCSSQVSTYRCLEKYMADALVPFAALGPNSNEHQIEAALVKVSEKSSTGKIVVKRSKSFASKGIVVLQINDETSRHIADLCSQNEVLVEPYMLTFQPQPYIHGIVRVVVIGTGDQDVVAGSFWRVTGKSEIVAGADDLFVYDKLEPEALQKAEQLALKACKFLSLEADSKHYEMGVDVILDQNSAYILEVNSGPIRISVHNKSSYAREIAHRWDDANCALFDSLAKTL